MKKKLEKVNQFRIISLLNVEGVIFIAALAKWISGYLVDNI